MGGVLFSRDTLYEMVGVTTDLAIHFFMKARKSGNAWWIATTGVALTLVLAGAIVLTQNPSHDQDFSDLASEGTNLTLYSSPSWAEEIGDSEQPVVPSTIQLAAYSGFVSNTEDGGRADDVVVLIYDVDIDPSSKVTSRSVFSIHNGWADGLLYRDESSVGSKTPVSWRWVKLKDTDQDGDQELVVSGTSNGVDACLHQEVFDYDAPSGLYHKETRKVVCSD